MRLVSQLKYIKCYFQTSNDASFSDNLSFEGTILQEDSGVILGVVHSLHSSYPSWRVLCGMKINEQLLFYDIDRFSHMTPQKFQFLMTDTQPEIFGFWTSIGFTEVGCEPAKLVFEERQKEPLSSREEILLQVEKWMKNTDAPSLIYFNALLNRTVQFCKENMTSKENVEEQIAIFSKKSVIDDSAVDGVDFSLSLEKLFH